MKKLAVVLTPLAASFVAILFYTVLHEGSHAIAVILQGGKVINFSINFITGYPHISYVGNLSDMQRALISIAGPLFPIIVWLPIVVFLSKMKPFFIKVTAIIFSITFLGSILALVFIPIVYLGGVKFASEDVIKFIEYSNLNPLFVSGVSLLLLVGGVIFFIRFSKINTIVSEFKQKYSIVLINSSKKTKVMIMIIFAIVVSFVIINVFSK